MMSESLITKVKETSLPDIRLENNDFWKIRVDPYATNTRWSNWSWALVDLVDDEEEIVHKLILQRWQCDLKKRKN